jgi:molybdopterin synthase catalytic subunit
MMNLADMLAAVKAHPQFHQAGMVLCHNGVVRATSREGRPVAGLKVAVDQTRLAAVLRDARQRPGIIDVRAVIAEDRRLSVGDDVMLLVVAGDVRENVISCLEDTLNAIKTFVTQKTEYFETALETE